MSRTTASNRVTLCIHKAAPTSSAQENNRPKTVFSERGIHCTKFECILKATLMPTNRTRGGWVWGGIFHLLLFLFWRNSGRTKKQKKQIQYRLFCLILSTYKLVRKTSWYFTFLPLTSSAKYLSISSSIF